MMEEEWELGNESCEWRKVSKALITCTKVLNLPETRQMTKIQDQRSKRQASEAYCPKIQQ
jgi:hypothetical protein